MHGGHNKLSNEQVDNILEKYKMKRYKNVEYKNSNTPIECVDEEGYIVMVRLADLKQGYKFRRFNTNNPYTLQNIQHFIDLKKLPIRLKEGQVYKGTNSKLIFICLIDNKEFLKQWNSFQQGYHCPYCTNSNSVAHEMNPLSNRKDLLIYLKNKEDGDNYSVGSHKKIYLICPICKFERKMQIKHFTNEGFNCKNCSDKISQPEKFCRGLLNQLIEQGQILDYKTQYVIKDRRYDFYFEKDNKKWILETNGEQHYKKGFSNFIGGKTVKEEQENDIFKRDLAMQNNIVEYIVINCSETTYKYLKESFTKELEKYFNLENIDWIEINKFCLNSLMIRAIELFKNNSRVKDIASILKVSESSVVKYLKKGNESKLCIYNVEEQRIKGLKVGWDLKRQQKLVKK